MQLCTVPDPLHVSQLPVQAAELAVQLKVVPEPLHWSQLPPQSVMFAVQLYDPDESVQASQLPVQAAALPTFAGQAVLEPVQVSATSQFPETGRQTVPDGAFDSGKVSSQFPPKQLQFVHAPLLPSHTVQSLLLTQVGGHVPPTGARGAHGIGSTNSGKAAARIAAAGTLGTATPAASSQPHSTGTGSPRASHTSGGWSTPAALARSRRSTPSGGGSSIDRPSVQSAARSAA